MIRLTKDQIIKDAEEQGRAFIEKNCPYTVPHTPQEKAMLEKIRAMIKDAFESGWMQSTQFYGIKEPLQ
jgi:hypothetical protein